MSVKVSSVRLPVRGRETMRALIALGLVAVAVTVGTASSAGSKLGGDDEHISVSATTIHLSLSQLTDAASVSPRVRWKEHPKCEVD